VTHVAQGEAEWDFVDGRQDLFSISQPVSPASSTSLASCSGPITVTLS